MARQIGLVRATGTIDGLTFYEMMGVHYVRRKSSLTKERIKKDKAYALFRWHSSLHGAAAKVAKPLYWMLPEKKRKHHMFGKLTAFVKGLMREGKSAEEIVEIFKWEYLGIREEKEKIGMVRRAEVRMSVGREGLIVERTESDEIPHQVRDDSNQALQEKIGLQVQGIQVLRPG